MAKPDRQSIPRIPPPNPLITAAFPERQEVFKVSTANSPTGKISRTIQTFKTNPWTLRAIRESLYGTRRGPEGAYTTA